MPATTDACIRALIHGVHSATEGRSRPNFLKFLTLRIIGPRLQDVTSNHATVAMRPRALRSYKSLYCKHLTHYSSGAPMRPGGPGIFSCLSPPLNGPVYRHFVYRHFIYYCIPACRAVIHPTSVSANHYFHQFQLLLTL